MGRTMTDSNRDLKIAAVLHRSDFGGAQRRVSWVARELENAGISTLIVFPMDDSDEYADYLSKNNFLFERISFPVIRRSISSVLRCFVLLPWTLIKFIRIFKNNNIDIVHINGVTNIQPVIAALIARKSIVWHWNDTLTPKYVVRLFSKLSHFKDLRLVVVTPYIVQHYRLESFDHSYIPAAYSVDNESLDAADINSLIRSDGEIYDLNDTKIIGFVSNIVAAKGAMEFVQLCIKYLKEHKKFIAVLVGAKLSRHSEFYDSLVQLINEAGMTDRIHFLGFQENIISVMSQLDVLVFPSKSEACPIVVLEAMEAGLPIVSTRVGHVPWMLEGSCYQIVEGFDVESLYQGLNSHYSTNDIDLQKSIDLLKLRVRQDYSLEKVSSLHRELYRKMSC